MRQIFYSSFHGLACRLCDSHVIRLVACPISAVHGSQARVTSDKAIISRKQVADFTVRSKGTHTTVVVEYATLPAEVTHINEEAIHLRGEFEVLEASDNCLLTALDKGNGGLRTCILWSSFFAVPNQESRCITALSSCTSDMVNMTTRSNECEEYDASEKRREEKANKELLNAHGGDSQS
ncbi:uncharacterized protein LOC125945650 [Dermacentor silvarum]|uniref:uncharacterized protein LOC125945650 n=1 Tax=Dermacentor silvarum TaxID=543639 RepID=UPI002101306E|nr:uncharacterized protein LOC125945650 [Dermacentor silvarum]